MEERASEHRTPRARDWRAEERRAVTRERELAGRNVPWRRKVRAYRRRIGKMLIPVLAPPLIRLLAWSWKVERYGEEHLKLALGGKGSLAAIWHGRMFPLLPIHANLSMTVLVSGSGDGGLVPPLLERFGYGAIRGSTSMGGPKALRVMQDRLRNGGLVVITPDGPRGPRHSMNVGLAWMAARGGLPIIPAGVACDRAWRLKTWDRFTIPKPRARVVVIYGDPMYVSAAASEQELENVTEEIRTRLIALETRGFQILGIPPDW